ncbi:hypothetical protein FOA52_011042 [Chlamydomonas sp. UWO 241]|nr:hypothetical protein FOA52_011042 [Chlamydomonas sp. UWO 241]
MGVLAKRMHAEVAARGESLQQQQAQQQQAQQQQQQQADAPAAACATLLLALLARLAEGYAASPGGARVGDVADALAALRSARVRVAPSDERACASLRALLSAAQPHLFLASPRELAMLAQCVGALRPPPSALPPRWAPALCVASAPKMRAMGPRALSGLAWGVAATMGQGPHATAAGAVPEPEWVAALLCASRAAVRAARVSDLSRTAWAVLQFDKATAGDRRWRARLAGASALGGSGLPELVGTSWGGGAAAASAHALPSVAAAAAAAQRQGGGSGAAGGVGGGSGGGGASWPSIAGAACEDWADAVWDAAGPQLAMAPPSEVVALAHAMSFLGPAPREGVTQQLYAALQAAAPRLSPAHDCHALGALARWRARPPPALLASLASCVQRRLPSYGHADLHLLLRALSRLGFLPPRPWLAAWLTVARARLRGFGPAGVVSVLRAFVGWRLVPPKEFTQDVLEVAAGLARAREFSPRQLSTVMRCVVALRLELPSELGRPPRWSREVLLVYAGIATQQQDPSDLASVLACLPRLLVVRAPSAVSLTAAPPGASGAQQAQQQGTPAGTDVEGASSAGSAGVDAGVVEGGGAFDAPSLPGTAPRLPRRSPPALDPHVLPSIAGIVDAAVPLLGAMTGPQLVRVAGGLAGVGFPASAALLDAHACAAAARGHELSERQVDALDKAYARMRASAKALRGAVAEQRGGASTQPQEF